MKVAIDAMLLRRPYTGVQRYITGLIRAIATHAPDVTLTAYIGRDHDGTFPDIENLHIRKAWIKNSFRPLRILWEQIILPFRVRAAGADIFHAPGYVMPALVPVIAGTPAVLTVHDLIALDSPDLVGTMNGLHYGLTMPASIRLARCVIVPTRVVADRIAKNNMTAQRIEVVPWGVDADIFTPDASSEDAEIVSKLGIKQPYVLHVGRLEQKKNIEHLIKAFFSAKMEAALPHTLVLAGAPGPSRKEILRLIRELAITDQVILAGHVSDADLASLYRQADLAVSASTEEGFGFPPLEALACGTAVIASDIPAFTETLAGAIPTLSPSDLPGLRKTMTDLLKDESARKDVVKSGKKRASLHTWKRCAERTCEIYRECL